MALEEFTFLASRVVIYGILGCFGEILWTASSASVLSLIRRSPIDLTLTGQTYLWMFPIYGIGGLVFEVVYAELFSVALPLRGLIYMVLIFIAEYLSGWVIKRLTGSIPWDYTGSPLSIHGLIRIDYAPVWFAVGILTEQVARGVWVSGDALVRLWLHV